MLLGDGHRRRRRPRSTTPARRSRRSARPTTQGQIRRFTGNDYTTDLAKGNLWVARRLLGRPRAAAGRQPGPRVRRTRGGRHAVHRQHDDARSKAEHPYGGRDDDELRLRARGRGEDRRLRQLHLARSRASRRSSRRPIPKLADEPADLPARRRSQAKLHPYPALSPAATSATMQEAMAEGDGGLRRDGCRLSLRSRRALLPWLFVGAGPAVADRLLRDPAASTSSACRCRPATRRRATRSTWNFGDLHGRDLRLPRRSSCARSATRRTATILCLIIAFPLAYFIAFKAGRWKNLMLLLIILPFFTSLRAADGRLAAILTDDGWVVDALQDDRPARRRRAAAGHAHGGDRRHHLQLPAVHGAAAVRRRSRRSTGG